MFEKRTSFQDSLFYDISAWTFPLAFNVDYFENSPLNIMGGEVSELKKPDIGTPNFSNYAYLMEWHEYYSPKAINLMLKKGIRIKVGMLPFKTNSRSYDYGTIIIQVQNQKLDSKELHSFLSSISKSCRISIAGVRTGLNDGIDLGSPQFKQVRLPEVALLVGKGISSYDAGEIWHLLDQRFDIFVTKLTFITF